MIVLPIQVNAKQFDLIICLESDNLERLQAYDPGEVNVAKLPEKWQSLQLRTVQIGYLKPEDMKETMSRMVSEQSPKCLLQKMFSGWKFSPEKGDHDGGPQRFLQQ